MRFFYEVIIRKIIRERRVGSSEIVDRFLIRSKARRIWLVDVLWNSKVTFDKITLFNELIRKSVFPFEKWLDKILHLRTFELKVF